MFQLYNPYKHKKAPGFLMFSGGIEKKIWPKMVYSMVFQIF